MTAPLTTADIWEPGLDLNRRSDTRVLGIAAVAAVMTDLAVHSGITTVTGFALVVMVAGGVLVSGRMQKPQARGLVALTPLFGFWLLVRASLWLIPLDIV
ncbi:MAG: hypothetical protein LC721_04780, partial [Actinobacteria bacterium]|nr:hypothetical protein [Actinomycetota bacterium]